MAKPKTIYSCTECGGQSPKWQGQCPHCNAWNTLVESVAETASVNRFSNHPTLAGVNAERGQVLQLSKVKTQDIPRQPTGIGEFDRVLGGGLVSGGVVLIGGDPGIGKSTMLLQALCAISASSSVLYVSGEESPQQIAMRANRLTLDTHDVKLLAVRSHRCVNARRISRVLLNPPAPRLCWSAT